MSSYLSSSINIHDLWNKLDSCHRFSFRVYSSFSGCLKFYRRLTKTIIGSLLYVTISTSRRPLPSTAHKMTFSENLNFHCRFEAGSGFLKNDLTADNAIKTAYAKELEWLTQLSSYRSGCRNTRTLAHLFKYSNIKLYKQKRSTQLFSQLFIMQFI